MRQLRQSPPLVRVAGALGVLLTFTALALSLSRTIRLFNQLYPVAPLNGDRAQALLMGISQLGFACAAFVGWYTARAHRATPGPLSPDTPLQLDSWKRQLVSLLIPTALPVCYITLALVLPSGGSYVVLTSGVEVAGMLGITLYAARTVFAYPRR